MVWCSIYRYFIMKNIQMKSPAKITDIIFFHKTNARYYHLSPGPCHEVVGVSAYYWFHKMQILHYVGLVLNTHEQVSVPLQGE